MHGCMHERVIITVTFGVVLVMNGSVAMHTRGLGQGKWIIV
jgi:hypothetical protein